MRHIDAPELTGSEKMSAAGTPPDPNDPAADLKDRWEESTPMYREPGEELFIQKLSDGTRRVTNVSDGPIYLFNSGLLDPGEVLHLTGQPADLGVHVPSEERAPAEEEETEEKIVKSVQTRLF